jgi:hypothetical protein
VLIRNLLGGVALVALLGGCAGQALAEAGPEATPISTPAPNADPFPFPSTAPARPLTPTAVPGWVEPPAYKFTLNSTCTPIGRFASTVVNGLVTENKGLDAPARRELMLHLSRLVPTLGQLEARARQSTPGGRADVVVKSDPADGHPVEISVGGTVCYQISDYSVG